MKRQGFTLLELLIVVVILGVLALIAAPSILNAADRAREGAVMANVAAASSSVTTRFALNSGDDPTAIAADVVGELAPDNSNPFGAGASFVVGAGAEGEVGLVGDDANDEVVITGYGKDGVAVITKTITAPES